MHRIEYFHPDFNKVRNQRAYISAGMEETPGMRSKCAHPVKDRLPPWLDLLPKHTWRDDLRDLGAVVIGVTDHVHYITQPRQCHVPEPQLEFGQLVEQYAGQSSI